MHNIYHSPGESRDELCTSTSSGMQSHLALHPLGGIRRLHRWPPAGGHSKMPDARVSHLMEECYAGLSDHGTDVRLVFCVRLRWGQSKVTQAIGGDTWRLQNWILRYCTYCKISWLSCCLRPCTSNIHIPIRDNKSIRDAQSQPLKY